MADIGNVHHASLQLAGRIVDYIGADSAGSVGMSDESELSKRIVRQARAEALLRDELFIEAFQRLDAEYVKAWRNTPARDTEARERLWQAVQIVPKIKDHFRLIIDQGTMAQAEIDRLTGKRPKVSVP